MFYDFLQMHTFRRKFSITIGSVRSSVLAIFIRRYTLILVGLLWGLEVVVAKEVVVKVPARVVVAKGVEVKEPARIVVAKGSAVVLATVVTEPAGAVWKTGAGKKNPPKCIIFYKC